MNPKEMMNEALLDAWLKEMVGDYEHGCDCEIEVLRRLNEADALRKENEELKAQNILIRGDNAELLAEADAYAFNISNMNANIAELKKENKELRKDKERLDWLDERKEWEFSFARSANPMKSMRIRLAIDGGMSKESEASHE